MRAIAVVLLLTLPLAGCLTGGQGDGTQGPAPAPGVRVDRPTDDPWNGSLRIPLAAAEGSGQQLDALCAVGGEVEVPRGDGRVLVGAGRLEVTVHVDATLTGLQVGYAVDGARQTWLPAAGSGDSLTPIRVGPDQLESPSRDVAPRWSFAARASGPGAAGAACGAGGGTGAWRVLVEAVKGNATA